MPGFRPLLLSLTFILLTFSSAFAATYYVTQSGAGSQNGTSQANAWSVANYNASTTPTGGDTVFFSGTITSQVIPNTSGTANGASRLTLDFTGATLTPPAITVSGKNFLTLNGGQIATDSGNNSIVFCTTSGAHDVTVQNFTFTGAAGNSGTDAFIELNHNCNNWTIQNNTIDNVVNAVIADGGSLSGTDIANNFFRSSTNTVQQTDVIFLPDCTTCTIEGNKLINQAPGNASNGRHNDVIQTFKSGSSVAVNPSNWILRYNWMQRAETDGSGGNMSWNEFEQITGNPALQAYGNVYVGGNATWAGGNGIDWHNTVNATDTFFFYNNTVYVHADPVNPARFGVGDGSAQAKLQGWENNIFSSDSNVSGNAPQVTFTQGTWDHNYFSNWAQCTATFSGPNGSCSVNPKFNNTTNNDFSLQSTSPMINAGDSTIGAQFDQGICPGATWPNPSLCTRSSGNWDAGAYQSSGSSSAPAAPATPVATVR